MSATRLTSLSQHIIQAPTVCQALCGQFHPTPDRSGIGYNQPLLSGVVGDPEAGDFPPGGEGSRQAQTPSVGCPAGRHAGHTLKDQWDLGH